MSKIRLYCYQAGVRFQTIKPFSVLVIFMFCVQWIQAATLIRTEVLVVGGTVSGTSAAIQAARSGVQVVMVESYPWLGGMLTSAGVSATDGNHLLPSGLWGEFRSHLYKYYGGPDALATGWVSNTQFEPHVGNDIFNAMVNEESNIFRVRGYHLIKALVDQQKVKGAVFVSEAGTDTLTVMAGISVDATEAGDLLAMAGCDYFIGQDPRSLTGEAGAPEVATNIIQDITYVAILKDYGPGTDKTIPKPDGYDPALYECTCTGLCNDEVKKKKATACDMMLTYGKLPNGKYMINWPENGNDYYLNDLEMNYYDRKAAYKKAKDQTLGWLYFIQTRGGYKNLGLAEDEFPTSDKLAFYPYYRESRRVNGLVQLHNEDLIDPYTYSQRKLYKTSISVGDYPLDLHHDKMPRKIEYKCIPVPSFSIPYECLVPQKMDGLLVAEKNISVSHIVNGCTRLQPSVMLIGQAAGAAAALCVQKEIQPKKIQIRELQEVLLNAHCWLMPYLDVLPEDPDFKSVQHIGLSGIMRGEGEIVDWANKTHFYPEQALTAAELSQIVSILKGEAQVPLDFKTIHAQKKFATRNEVMSAFYKLLLKKNPDIGKLNVNTITYFNNKLPETYTLTPEKLKGNISRKEAAVWIDTLFDPFHAPCSLMNVD